MAGAKGKEGGGQEADALKELKGIKQASLGPFWAKILNWDWFEDVVDDRTEANATSEELMLKHAERLHGEMKDVPEQFESVEEYVSAFEPLFFHESRMQIARCKSDVKESEQMTFKEVKTRDKFDSNNFVGIELHRDPSVVKNIRYMTDDLVLLSTNPDPKVQAVHRLCFVENCQGTTLSLTWHVNMDTNVSAQVREFAKALKDSSVPWYCSTISSMATVYREYRALHGLKFKEKFPLRRIILNSKNPDSDDEHEDQDVMDVPEPLLLALKNKYNDSQFKAMKEIFQKPFGMTLVQGPPGTGKTTTIMGITAALLHAKPKIQKVDPHEQDKIARAIEREEEHIAKKKTALKDIADTPPLPRVMKKKSIDKKQIFQTQKYLHKSFTPWYDESEGLTVKAPADTANETKMLHRNNLRREMLDMSVKEVPKKIPQKVLICAPSNAAIDEIVRRLVGDGIVGADGVKYKPSVVRLGPNVAPDLAQYGLNQIVDKKLIARGQRHDNPSELKVQTLQEARVICCTLSVAGSRDLLEYPDGFDIVVIDEAAQCVEVSNLIPLQMGCKRLVLIGDPLQLPATVFAQASQDKKYNRSLFERLQKTQNYNVLSKQYRMHPTISFFPRKYFYDNKLFDAENIFKLTGDKVENPWYMMPLFQPLMFFNVRGVMYSTQKSWKNNTEVEFICAMIWWLRKLFPDQKFDGRIGVISPYQSQCRAIRKHLNKTIYHLDTSKDIPVKVSTVDGFQGSEKDIIILSTVRSGPTPGIGFVDDIKRMNVSITRPRLNLFVVGDANKLCDSSLNWKAFVQNCAKKNGLIHVPAGKSNFSEDGDQVMRTFVPLHLRQHYRKHHDRWHPENELFENYEDKSIDSLKHLDSIGLPQSSFILEDGAEIPERRKKKEEEKDKEKEKKGTPANTPKKPVSIVDHSPSEKEASDDEAEPSGDEAPQEKGRFNSDGEWEPCSDDDDDDSDISAQQKKVHHFYDLTEEEQLKLAQEAQDSSKLLAGQNHLADTEIAGAVEGAVEEEPTPTKADVADKPEDESATKRRKLK